MITRLPVVDDVGDGTSGTIINAAWWTQVQNMIDARWSVYTVISGAGIVHDHPTNEADLVVMQNNAGPLTITGFVAPAGPAKPGKILHVIALGGVGNTLTFPNGDAGSLPPNRLYNATLGPVTLKNAGCAAFVYVNGLWLMISAFGQV